MAGTLDRIRAWATHLPYWEQAALERIASGAVLTDRDYDDLLDLWMQAAQLAPKLDIPPPALTFPTKLEDKSDAAGYTLKRLFNLRNVNALPAAQEMMFGPQLTVVYGSNSSGKTGYTRPLGCAAFARGEREVLTDAHKAHTNVVPQADIEIARTGAEKTVTWVHGARRPELRGVYVFDGTSTSAHLTQSNALSFSPAGLSLLTRLVDATDKVRERLRARIEGKSARHTFDAFFPGDSPISREIANLSEKTDLGALEQAAVLSADDETRISELDRKIVELKSRGIPKLIATLRQEVEDLRQLVGQLDETAVALGPAAEDEVRALIIEATSRRREAERVGADQFRSAQFTQVGGDVWREFITAAKALADAEAQRGRPYPQSADACLFCRQALSAEAIDLINRLWEFLTSDAPARLRTAQEACSIRARRFQEVPLSFFGTDSVARRILDNEAPELVAEIDAFLGKCSIRSVELQTMLKTSSTLELGVSVPPNVEQARAAINRRLNEIFELETTDSQKEIEHLEQSLLVFRHRQALGRHLADIRAWVAGKKWAARAEDAVGSTHHITAMYNKLFKDLVTDRYLDLFQATLRKLSPDLKLTIETRGQKGETRRQIALSPDAFAQRIAVNKILSDGEQRAVALADFLTEVALDACCTAIVLDDPVSSLDCERKKAIAQLLVEHAAMRQVIVFTHDLGFLHHLKVRAESNVEVASHWIRSEAGHPGYVYLNNSPMCEGDYKSARVARDCYAKAKNAPPEEQQKLLQQGFGALRTSYEAFVIYSLFNKVVMRFEERVSFDRLKDVSLDRGIVEQVVSKMSILSRYIDAHLHSDASLEELPTPRELLNEIEAFEELHRKHGESKKRPGPAGGTKAASATAGESLERPSVSP